MARKVAQNKTSNGSDSFMRLALAHLSRLSRAADALIRAHPAGPKNAAALTRVLGVLKKSGWQLYRLAEVENPADATRFLPGTKPLREMAETARRQGVPGAVVDELLAAYADFDRFIDATAGDLSSLISMLATPAEPSAESAADAERQHRAMAFKASVHFSGMQVDLSQDIDFLSETDPGRRQDVSMRTVRGMRRLRPDSQCVVDTHRSFKVGNPSEKVGIRPLDQAAFKEHGVPVIPRFCSRPLPELVLTYDEDPNRMFVEWASKTVGLAGKVDVTTGTVNDLDVDTRRDGKEHGVRFATRVGYPARRMKRTWLVRLPHRNTLVPRLRGYLDPLAIHSEAEAKRSPRLYTNEKIETYPAGSWNKLPKSCDVDREQITYASALMGWDPAEFAIYTLDIDYPLLNSVIIVEFPWI